MKRIFVATLFFAVAFVATANASSGVKDLQEVPWAFEGFAGTVDRSAAQRGFQVYKEVCSSCHGVKRVAFRNLAEIGFAEAEIKALAAEYTVEDGPNDDGDMFERAAKPFDRLPSPFANDNAARVSNGGALPPDLSLMVKARPNGANYIFSLLTGYGEDAPHDMEVSNGMYYNPYFAGSKLAMAAPLSDGLIEYQDGTIASTEQMAKDVVVFLQWTSEPEMEQRKQMGMKVMLFLLVISFLAYAAKKVIWRNVD